MKAYTKAVGKVKEQDYKKVKDLLALGFTSTEIRNKFGYSYSTIARVKRARTFGDYKNERAAEHDRAVAKSDTKQNGTLFEQSVLQPTEIPVPKPSSVVLPVDLVAKLLAAVNQTNEYLKSIDATLKRTKGYTAAQLAKPKEEAKKKGIFNRG